MDTQLFPSRIYVQSDEYNKEILAFSLFPFHSLEQNTARLYQFKVEHELTEQLDSSVLNFHIQTKTVVLDAPEKKPCAYSLKQLKERKTIVCAKQYTVEKKKEETKIDTLSESESESKKGHLLVNDLRVLILSFLSKNPFGQSVALSREWKLALDTFSFLLPHSIFTRAYVTKTYSNLSKAILHSVSYYPMKESNRSSETLEYDLIEHGPVFLLQWWNMEEIESFPLHIKEGLIQERQIFGTPSLYYIVITWSSRTSFSFSIQRSDTMGKGKEKHYLPLSSFISLQKGGESICNFKFEDKATQWGWNC